ncbi:MAG: hypothetical protein BWY76_00174 [bacterium ADurb.Bin429]|nr:MAG: hypothetical protein BWY76_00174 [bacterium ADurb.Bin429]
MRILSLLLLLLGIMANAAPLATFTINDHLNHRWTDELVHFDFAVQTDARELVLVDGAGRTLPCQFSNLSRQGRQVAGTVWTVVDLEPGKGATLALQPGKPEASALKWAGQTLTNDRLAVYLAQLPGALDLPKPLGQLPPPILAVGRPGGPRQGEGMWANVPDTLLVKEATTRIVEQGPVRITIEQRYLLTDGREYRMTVQLGLRQDAALITEDGTLSAPGAGFRFDMRPGLHATRVLWHNQWKATAHAKTWEQVETDVTRFAQPTALCVMRPWSFWWDDNITEWAGFFDREDGEMIGVIALRPSRWAPYVADGFQRTQMTVTGGGGQLHLTFPFVGTAKDAAGKEQPAALHREWALTIGPAAQRVDEKKVAALRRQLIKYGEFPLDEVKEFAFGYTPSEQAQRHPFLLLTQDDLDRSRRQAREVSTAKAALEPNLVYVKRCLGTRDARQNWEDVYQNVFWGMGLTEKLPEAYLTSDDPALGWAMAAAVRGYARDLRTMLLEVPSKPALGAMGPWYSEHVTRLLFAYDMLADTEYLTLAEKAEVRAMLVLGAHFLAHPDYWNIERGLCSGNPNMTVSIILPQGLFGLALQGHPRAETWLKAAEDELRLELNDYIDANGAWVECPGYQSASLDAIFILMQAIRNVTGRDYFNDPRFKMTMDYYGFLQTPPDWRFPPGRKENEPAVMTVPTVGDTPAGFVHCFNGWMAKATEKADPFYSARQQFFWQRQLFSRYRAGRGAGYLPGMTDYALPAAPPVELSRGFPGFGSVLRTSWADQNAAYVAHRTGPFSHHYHDDCGSFIFFAKGAPLAMDFGNQYAPVRRDESYYHNRISFDLATSPKRYYSSGELLEMRSLPATLDYSRGKLTGNGGQLSERRLLLVKSDNPLGANYVVIRDRNSGGPEGQRFYWNLWCLATGVEGIRADGMATVLHFPGQHVADLDAHFVQPTSVQVTLDSWQWKNRMNIAGTYVNMVEEMHGAHVTRDGADRDFFTVLYPRTKEKAGVVVTSLADGAGARITHGEGADYLLLAPVGARNIEADGVWLHGEVAFARRDADGAIRLAVVNGEASYNGWVLNSPGAASLRIADGVVAGESDGPAHTVTVGVPMDCAGMQAFLNGKPLPVKRAGDTLTLALPAGAHIFMLKRHDR